MQNTKKGFIPVMLTPFTDEGKVDYNALTELTEFYLKAGASGLFANCLSSEMYELSAQERLQVTRHVVKVAGGSVPVVATGTFGGPIEQQADFVKQIYDTGVQAVIAITSLLASQNETAEVFMNAADRLLQLTGDVPIGFYECPDPYKRALSAEQLQHFVQTGRIIYHKDTSLDINQIKDKLALTQGYNFGLYDAYMAHAVETLKAGSAGLSCIQGNYFPELIVWLCDNYNNPALTNEIDKVQQFLVDNMDVMHHVYPTTAKYYLQKRGLNMSTFTRRKVGDFTTSIQQNIDQLYQSYSRLQEECGVEAVV
ncbi:dihydrodipicolinate synthase family protein [Mucilaginibacter robiniae]|uniref:Dihydrodipicolinate synthase family protein n=1 Tax=Mucilaginibacter robiniae TaxID=2728022 RepID=A0A7L5E1N8_9SPHI|nr:dihydrodipicolinate synthase family protein [Mucilaginibacter robiniae]QJD97282.1 dihydrodipicolinate synthase family protein [Mucilaginibacter robiniae]